MKAEELLSFLQQHVQFTKVELVNGSCIAELELKDLISTLTSLKNHPQLFFDSLSCLTAIDNGAQLNTMEVIYQLYSIPFNHSLMVKTKISREKPEIDSVESIWKTANWHEREAYDMFGIIFNNHPDLRRILMPADWEGFPLRKDYHTQETYRNIKVDYQQP
jgi:NADH-quinone oxidoreductase subunit C